MSFFTGMAGEPPGYAARYRNAPDVPFRCKKNGFPVDGRKSIVAAVILRDAEAETRYRAQEKNCNTHAANFIELAASKRVCLNDGFSYAGGMPAIA